MSIEMFQGFNEQISVLVSPVRFDTFSSSSFCELKIKSSEQINLNKGDFIKIFGKKRATVCKIKKISYGYKDNNISLPYKIRNKYGINLNDFIRIQTFPKKTAKYVKLTPVDLDFKPTKKVIKFIRKKLLDMPLVKNDIILINIGFKRQIDFEVLNIQPTSPAQISTGTVIDMVLSYHQEEKIKEKLILTLTI